MISFENVLSAKSFEVHTFPFLLTFSFLRREIVFHVLLRSAVAHIRVRRPSATNSNTKFIWRKVYQNEGRGTREGERLGRGRDRK